MPELIKPIVERIRKSQTYKELTADVRENVETFLNALLAGHFFFEEEQWYGDSQGLPCEMLLRVYNRNAERINMGPALAAIYNCGFGENLYTFLVTTALEQAARNHSFPVSINIAPHLAVSKNFWDLLQPVLTQYNPREIIFEILEPEIPATGNIKILKELRKEGYRFALDDAEDNEDLERRLEFFGPCLDFVKLDGKEIKKEFAGGNNLAGLISKIKAIVPQAQVIAEWVEDIGQASWLQSRFNVNAVQGRALDPEQMEELFNAASIPPHTNHHSGLFHRRPH